MSYKTIEYTHKKKERYAVIIFHIDDKLKDMKCPVCEMLVTKCKAYKSSKKQEIIV